MDDFIRPKRRSPLSVTDNSTIPSGRSESSRFSAREEKDNMPEPKFRVPEDMADEDIVAASKYGDPVDFGSKEAKTSKVKKRWSALWRPHGKKQWIITILVLILILGGGASAYWFGIRKPSKPAAVVVKPTVKKVEPPVPTTETSKLSGLQVPIGTNLKPVTSVMIENSPDARPQSGLKDASIIFEAIAEGGITRFNALFQDTTPDYVGPIRSVRPYYIDWFWPFDASVAHVGGSPKALNDIKSLGIKDLDQFANSGSYDRISSRFAPHNVYTSIARLNSLEQSKGYTTATYEGFLRKPDAKVATPTARIINLNISSYYFNVQYIYDAATNSYMRSEGGAVHRDDKSGTQLSPKVVVAIVMGRGIDTDGQHTAYTTTGTGHMYVYQDGMVTEGSWSKDSRQAQWKFADSAGKPIAFNQGQTWITMVDSNISATYAP